MPQDEILSQMHKHSHDDDQRYRLLMVYLRLLEKERGSRGFLRKLRKQWRASRESAGVDELPR